LGTTTAARPGLPLLRSGCASRRMISCRNNSAVSASAETLFQRAQELFPLMSIEGVQAAAFLPTDGQVNPSDITQSLAKGARLHGARIASGLLRIDDQLGINLRRRGCRWENGRWQIRRDRPRHPWQVNAG
jgi:glycine/D-amino acid oxidase-like deaminating enzyme